MSNATAMIYTSACGTTIPRDCRRSLTRQATTACGSPGSMRRSRRQTGRPHRGRARSRLRPRTRPAPRNQLNPDERQRTNRRHHHWRAVAPPPTRSTRNSLARTVTGAQQHTVNHTTNLPDPGIAGGGTAVTTGREPATRPPGRWTVDINGHDSPHSPTRRNTLMRDHIVTMAYWACSTQQT